MESKTTVKNGAMSEEEINSPDDQSDEPPVPISKAVLFFVLSILWVFPSIGAGWLIGADFRSWLAAKSVMAALSAVKFEQWLALLLLCLHLVFVILALRFRSRERRII